MGGDVGEGGAGVMHPLKPVIGIKEALYLAPLWLPNYPLEQKRVQCTLERTERTKIINAHWDETGKHSVPRRLLTV